MQTNTNRLKFEQQNSSPEISPENCPHENCTSENDTLEKLSPRAYSV